MATSDPAAPQPYVEALPRFNILTLAAEWRRGARLLFWYDENHALIGGASIDLAGSDLALSFSIEAPSLHIDAGEGHLDFQVITRIEGNRPERFAVICPGCNNGKEVLLLFERKWRCSKCHDVTSLSNNLDRDTRLYLEIERFDKLAAIRPKGMHHATHARNVKHYKGLRKAWGKRAPRSLRADQMPRANERYFKRGEAPLPSDPEPPL